MSRLFVVVVALVAATTLLAGGADARSLLQYDHSGSGESNSSLAVDWMLDFTSRFNDANYTGISALVSHDVSVLNPIGSPEVTGPAAFIAALQAMTAQFSSFMVEALAPVEMFNVPGISGNYATMVMLVGGLSEKNCQVHINAQVVLEFATPYVVSGWSSIWDVNAAAVRFNASCGSSSTSTYGE